MTKSLEQNLETMPKYEFFEKLKSGELIPVSQYNKKVLVFPFQGEALPYYSQYGIEGGVWWKLYSSNGPPLHDMIFIRGKSIVPAGKSYDEVTARLRRGYGALCQSEKMAQLESCWRFLKKLSRSILCSAQD